ncbi:hypothetical protein [Coleofasciculus sp. G2-EDA-02]
MWSRTVIHPSFMFDWVWLSRVAGLGLVGTAAGSTLFFGILGRTFLSQPNNRHPNSIDAIAPLKTQAVTLPPQPLPLLTLPNSTSASEVSQKSVAVLSRPFDLKQSLNTYQPLFATPTSLGMVAIGVAEGNYRLFIEKGDLYVQQTSFYFGHTDPGNLSWGDVVTNYGPCSDQGRSKGNIALAEQLCVERSRSRLPTHLVDLNAAGIDPERDLEALLNVADLYNQAMPIHSRHFPHALAIAKKGGLRGIDALAWARTASFYLNVNNELDLETGSNKATGLLGICARENLPITEWDCVYKDQMRRVKAIASVVEKYSQIYQSKTN